MLLSGCENANQIAMKIGVPPDSAVKARALETRRFDTSDEPSMLASATQTLQDLGFTISESQAAVGVLVGSKQRDAEETKQVVGQIVLTVVLAALGTQYTPVWDKDQNIDAMLLVTPIENSKQVEVRVSFDRQVRNTQGQIRGELILDETIYQQFFEKLAASVFLEAHKI